MTNEQGKPQQHIKAIESIYVAGKMHDAEWRMDFFDGHHCGKFSHNPLTIEDGWPEYGLWTICGLLYTGPFFVDNLGGHGYHRWETDTHGNIGETRRAHSEELADRRREVQSWCFDAIRRADLLFAWINSADCYGTIAEIGYAKALGKRIWIAGPTHYSDLWFVYEMADRLGIFDREQGAKGKTPASMVRFWLRQHQRDERTFDSPIEEKFWKEWVSAGYDDSYELTSQHPIGAYRVDFAHIPTKTAIELDGFATHSSTDDIAKDRKRQRQIEALGWHVIRFGGKEIYSDADTCVKETADILDVRTQKGPSL